MAVESLPFLKYIFLVFFGLYFYSSLLLLILVFLLLLLIHPFYLCIAVSFYFFLV